MEDPSLSDTVNKVDKAVARLQKLQGRISASPRISPSPTTSDAHWRRWSSPAEFVYQTMDDIKAAATLVTCRPGSSNVTGLDRQRLLICVPSSSRARHGHGRARRRRTTGYNVDGFRPEKGLQEDKENIARLSVSTQSATTTSSLSSSHRPLEKKLLSSSTFSQCTHGSTEAPSSQDSSDQMVVKVQSQISVCFGEVSASHRPLKKKLLSPNISLQSTLGYTEPSSSQDNSLDQMVLVEVPNQISVCVREVSASHRPLEKKLVSPSTSLQSNDGSTETSSSSQNNTLDQMAGGVPSQISSQFGEMSTFHRPLKKKLLSPSASSQGNSLDEMAVRRGVPSRISVQVGELSRPWKKKLSSPSSICSTETVVMFPNPEFSHSLTPPNPRKPLKKKMPPCRNPKLPLPIRTLNLNMKKDSPPSPSWKMSSTDTLNPASSTSSSIHISKDSSSPSLKTPPCRNLKSPLPIKTRNPTMKKESPSSSLKMSSIEPLNPAMKKESPCSSLKMSQRETLNLNMKRMSPSLKTPPCRNLKSPLPIKTRNPPMKESPSSSSKMSSIEPLNPSMKKKEFACSSLKMSQIETLNLNMKKELPSPSLKRMSHIDTLNPNLKKEFPSLSLKKTSQIVTLNPYMKKEFPSPSSKKTSQIEIPNPNMKKEFSSSSLKMSQTDTLNPNMKKESPPLSLKKMSQIDTVNCNVKMEFPSPSLKMSPSRNLKSPLAIKSLNPVSSARMRKKSPGKALKKPMNTTTTSSKCLPIISRSKGFCKITLSGARDCSPERPLPSLITRLPKRKMPNSFDHRPFLHNNNPAIPSKETMAVATPKDFTAPLPTPPAMRARELRREAQSRFPTRKKKRSHSCPRMSQLLEVSGISGFFEKGKRYPETDDEDAKSRARWRREAQSRCPTQKKKRSHSCPRMPGLLEVLGIPGFFEKGKRYPETDDEDAKSRARRRSFSSLSGCSGSVWPSLRRTWSFSSETSLKGDSFSSEEGGGGGRDVAGQHRWRMMSSFGGCSGGGGGSVWPILRRSWSFGSLKVDSFSSEGGGDNSKAQNTRSMSSFGACGGGSVWPALRRNRSFGSEKNLSISGRSPCLKKQTKER